MPDALASILDADAHASRKAAAANLHAAQRDGAYTGGPSDSPQTIRAYAARAAGMDYRPPYLTMKAPANVKMQSRSKITERGCWRDVVAAAPRAAN
jgi:hypothetical protein